MVVRVIGIGLLIIVGLPLAIVLLPVLVLGLGGWFVASRWWSGASVNARLPEPLRSALTRRPGSGWHPSELMNHTHLGGAGRSSYQHRDGTGRAVLALLFVVLLLSVIGTIARQAPFLLVPLLAVGGFLALRTVMRRQRPASPHAVPATAPVLPVLPDAEFEQRVASLLHAYRYHNIQPVRQVGQPDMDIDLIARDQRGHLFLVLGQQYAAGNRARSADVQRLVDAVRREQAAGGIFVTTATFTQAAINLAQYSRVPIFLFDGRALSRVPARPTLAWPAA